MKKMYRPSTKAQFLGKSRQPIEGLFCAYTHRKCMQNRLEGYEYCLKHILEDKNAPFKQCSYTSSKSAKRCTNASSKSDRKDGYCLEHSRRAVLIRQRVSRKKRPKETPETLLEDLEPYAGIGRQYVEHDHKRGHGTTSKALEYASSSDSDAETPVVDQAWKGDDDSDAESVDSEQEDLLKHAGVYTAEEVALIMRDKLIRLQSLYIDQFKRLQHVMREKRRKYLHTHKQEQEKLGGMGQYVKDADQRDNWNRLSAMKRYHKRFGAEALLHRQSKQRRIAVSEGASYKPPSYPRCIHDTGDGKCTAHALPLSKFCLNHILQDSHQVLYQPCSFGGGDCSRPVATLDDGPPHCPLHAVLVELQTSEQANDAEDNDTEDSTVDMTLDVTMDTSNSLATTEAGSPKVGTSCRSGDSENNNPQELDPATREALMKKGRLLLRHLQTLDAQMTQTAGSPTQPSGSRSAPSQLNFNPFIFLTQPQNVVQPQSTVQPQNAIQSQRTVQIQGTGKLKTVSKIQQGQTVGLNVVQHTGKVENIGKLQISTQIQAVGQSQGITQSQNNGKLQSIGQPQITGQPQCTGQPQSSQLQIPVQPQSSQLQSTGQLQNTEQQTTGELQSSSEIVELQTRESLQSIGQPQPSVEPHTTEQSGNTIEQMVIDVPQSLA